MHVTCTPKNDKARLKKNKLKSLWDALGQKVVPDGMGLVSALMKKNQTPLLSISTLHHCYNPTFQLRNFDFFLIFQIEKNRKPESP